MYVILDVDHSFLALEVISTNCFYFLLNPTIAHSHIQDAGTS